MLEDLPATERDAENAKKIAMSMGIPEANIKTFNNATVQSLTKYFRQTGLALGSKNVDGKRSFMLVYCAGHGVCDQMQHFVLNDAKENVINIEERLRSLAKNTDTSILAFYDACKSEKSSFPNLKMRGGDDLSSFGEKYEYLHIGTHPRQTVEAESKLARITIEQLNKKSEESATGLIHIPGCFTGIGEQHVTGVGYSIQWKKST